MIHKHIEIIEINVAPSLWKKNYFAKEMHALFRLRHFKAQTSASIQYANVNRNLPQFLKRQFKSDSIKRILLVVIRKKNTR